MAAEAGSPAWSSDVNQRAFWQANTQPSSGDDMYVRNAMHNQARDISTRMFAALQQYLHGDNPVLNFVGGGSPLIGNDGHASATTETNTINVDPVALASLINPSAVYHGSAVAMVPHEMAHLRQLQNVLASVGASEGGAQAFSDITAADAARQARVPFNPGSAGYYDGEYAQYVKNVLDELGRAWVLFKQFGNTPPAS